MAIPEARAGQQTPDQYPDEQSPITWILRDIPNVVLAPIDRFKSEIGSDDYAAHKYIYFARKRKEWNVQNLHFLKSREGIAVVLDPEGNEVPPLSDAVERQRMELIEETARILQADDGISAEDLRVQDSTRARRIASEAQEKSPSFDLLQSYINRAMQRTKVFAKDNGWGLYTLGEYRVGYFHDYKSIDLIGRQIAAQNVVFQLIEAAQYRGRMLHNLKRKPIRR